MFSFEIMSTLKVIKSHFKLSYDNQNLTLVTISYEMTTRVRSSIYAQAKSLFKSKQEKMVYFTKLLFCPKKKIWASNFFMQIFSESILCRQSIELFQHKLWYKLNSPHMLCLCKYHTKLLSQISSHFAKNTFLHDTRSCTFSIYLYCRCKVSESFNKSSGTS